MTQPDAEKKEPGAGTKDNKVGHTFEDLAKSMQTSFSGNAFLRNPAFSGGTQIPTMPAFPAGGFPFPTGKQPMSFSGGLGAPLGEKPQIEFVERKPVTPAPSGTTSPINTSLYTTTIAPSQQEKAASEPQAPAKFTPTLPDHKPKTANTVDRSAQPKTGTSSKDPLNLLGSRLRDKYEITKFLGQGGMGAVYAAKHRLLEEEIAIKFLVKSESIEQISIDRFIAEAKAAMRIKHPNIVQVYDLDEMDEFYFIVMEYVRGEGVDDILKREGALPGPKAVDIILQASLGLAAIHNAGLVHRDIKPANFMRTREGIIKIADFGIVKQLKSDKALTAANAVLGTPQFMAPEQISNPDIDSRADIYALGATFFFLVTNRYAFQGSTMQLLFQVMNEAPVPPHTLVPTLDPDISKIILKMMEKDPAKRHQSATELIQVLKNYKASKKC